MDNKPFIAVLYHLFYEDSFDAIHQELQPLRVYNPVFLFNISLDTPDKLTMAAMLRNAFKDCIIITTSNLGKDIGGKLALFQLYLFLEIQTDYMLFLHDKKSLHALKSSTWKNDLLKILSPKSIEAITTFFRKNETCGIVATKEYIVPEVFENNRFSGTNGPILSKIMREHDINPNSYEFVAGTMFWARAQPLVKFFTKKSPLEIRKTLEQGNVIDNFSGTITHSWERMLSWIYSDQGYFIKGI